ncbi:MAG: COG4280 domain-containing protein [Hyphomonadaceae bacterium]
MFDAALLFSPVAAPALAAAFFASVVEIVEAFTIVLAVASLQGWRPAAAGAAGAIATLALLVLGLGPALTLVPLHALQFVIGTALLLFGMGWLRKAVLRGGGVMALHDEEAIFAEERAALSSAGAWAAGVAAYKAVLLEGLEVVFIVIAVGAKPGLMAPAAIGALAASLLVLAVGAVLHRPLSRVPENTLKFGVGAMMSAFGVFWTGEALGVRWPGQDWALLGLGAAFLAGGSLLTAAVRGVRERGLA